MKSLCNAYTIMGLSLLFSSASSIVYAEQVPLNTFEYSCPNPSAFDTVVDTKKTTASLHCLYAVGRLCKKNPWKAGIASATFLGYLAYTMHKKYPYKSRIIQKALIPTAPPQDLVLNNPHTVKQELYETACYWHQRMYTDKPEIAQHIDHLLTELSNEGRNDQFHYAYVVIVGRKPHYTTNHHVLPAAAYILQSINTGTLSTQEAMDQLYSLGLS